MLLGYVDTARVSVDVERKIPARILIMLEALAKRL
jgi:hypothetical protein